MKQLPIRDCPFVILTLTKGFVAVVDKEVWNIVRRFHWYAHISRGKGRNSGQPYARSNINGKKVYLHRLLMDCPSGFHVDHKNHQTLDCRRANLEVVTHTENQSRRRNVKEKATS
jgi:hypothetical protein